jgi:anti-anti-sigma factor
MGESPMKITVTHKQGKVPVAVLHITGAIDSSNSNELDSYASNIISSGDQYLLLDLAHVHFLSSAGLRSLLRIYRQLHSLSDEENTKVRQGILTGTYKSPYLKLLDPSELVVQTLKIAGWDMIFEIYRDLNKAIASFQAS